MKFGYKVARSLGEGGFIGSSSSPLQSRWWKSLWLFQILNKIKKFLWRAYVSAIPTASALAKRKVLLINTCGLCNSRTEDALHALWTCSRAQGIWKQVAFSRTFKHCRYSSFADLCRHAFLFFLVMRGITLLTYAGVYGIT